MSAAFKATGRTPKPASRSSRRGARTLSPNAAARTSPKARRPSPRASEAKSLREELSETKEALRLAQQRNGVLEAASIRKISEIQARNEELEATLERKEQHHQASILAQTVVERDLNAALQQIGLMRFEIQELEGGQCDQELKQQLGGLMQAHGKVEDLLRSNLESLTPRGSELENEQAESLRRVGKAHTSQGSSLSPGRSSLLRIFKQYASKTSTSGDTFDQIAQHNQQMDLAEFVSFAQDFGLLELFSLLQLRQMFVAANVGAHADDRRSSLSLDEFSELVRECCGQLEAHSCQQLQQLMGSLDSRPVQPASQEPPQAGPEPTPPGDSASFKALLQSTSLLKQANRELQAQLDAATEQASDAAECEEMLGEAALMLEQLRSSNRSLSQETLALRSQLARSMLDCQQLRSTPRPSI